MYAAPGDDDNEESHLVAGHGHVLFSDGTVEQSDLNHFCQWAAATLRCARHITTAKWRHRWVHSCTDSLDFRANRCKTG